MPEYDVRGEILKRIHVNRHRINANRKHGDKTPVIAVRYLNGVEYADGVDILDENGTVVASVIYRPDKPLSCGAVCWVESRAQLRLRKEGVE